MGCIQRIRQLHGNFQQRLRIDWLLCDPMLQGFTLQILHDHERPAVVFSDLVNRADVWVIKRRDRTRLPLESLQSLSVT